MSFRLLLALLLPGCCYLLQAEDPRPFLEFDAGRVTVHPSGFFDQIAQFRTEPTGESISTHFGRFPLSGGPSEWVSSAAHSRLQTKAWSDVGGVKFIAYYEMDFQGTNVEYRTRQLYGAMESGKWHVTAGRTWTLMRPNRWAMEGDAGVWSTDVIEPQYHVGLVGFRKEQVRIARYDDHWGVAVAAERRTEKTGVDGTVKLMRQAVINGKRYHFEGSAMAGGGRSGFSVSAIVPIVKRLQFVTQEYYSHRALSEALGLVPVGVTGTSFIHGLEARLTRNLELYGYGGVAFANRTSTGNHHVQEITGGIQRLVPFTSWHGTMRTCLQVSHMNRDIWTGREGGLTQVILQLRYELP